MKPRLVLCEKPITSDLKKTAHVLSAYRRERVPLAVNYFRQYDEHVQQLASDVKRRTYGKVLSASGIYSKGILHNGSHMISLARLFFGEVKRFKVFNAVADYGSQDRTVSAVMEFNRCKQFHLVAADERAYSIFELEILFEKARIRYLNSGMNMNIQLVEAHKLYKGYRSLANESSQETSLDTAMSALIANGVKNLRGQEKLIVSGEDAYVTQKACHQLLSAARSYV